jgi:primosomal protein N''
MKPNPVDETFGSIEHHIRQAREQRAAYLAGLLSSAITAATRALSGTTARVASATQATARPAQLHTPELHTPELAAR